MNKKGFALFLTKPFLWFLYIILVTIFLIFFTVSGVGSSDRDYSVVGEEMPEFITTIEAINYLKTMVGDTTVYDMLLKAINEGGVDGQIYINSAELELLTNSFIEIKDIKLEDVSYPGVPSLTQKHYTIRIAVNKAGNYKLLQEVVLYLPSTVADSPYIKLIMEIPYSEKEAN